MDSMPAPEVPPIEDLLREAPWLRGLARRIVHGADVEDVLQDTWTAALATPPKDSSRLRAWLGQVARRFALRRRHNEQRRSARERQAARSESLPATESALDRLAAVSRLNEALVALAEPYRATLLWHFYDGLAVREIAARSQSSEVNVRKRIERGIEMLRARLSGELGSDWRSMLVPVFAPGSVTVMKKLSLALAFGLLLGGSLVVFWPGGPQAASNPEEGHASLVVAAATTVETKLVARESQTSARSAVDALPAIGRVVDVHGKPLPNVGVAGDGERIPCDGEGHLALTGDPTAVVFTVEPDWFLLDILVGGVAGRSELVLVAAPAVSLACAIDDDEGTPLAGVAIGYEARPPVRERLKLTPSDAMNPWEITSAIPGTYCMRLPAVALELTFTKRGFAPRTVWLAEDGAVVTKRPEPGLLSLFAQPGVRIAQRPLVSRDKDTLRVTLEAIKPPACKITGQVLDARGLPVQDAFVGFQQHLSTTSDADGRFCLELDPNHLPGKAPPLFAAKLGMQPALLSDVVERLHSAQGGALEVTLRLGEAPLSIRGRVLSATGKPCTGVVVFPWGSEDLGGHLGTPEDLALPPDAPQIHHGLHGRRAIARTDADGRFTLPGLLQRDYRLRVSGELSPLVFTSSPIRAGSEGVDIVLPKDHCDFAVTGTVRDLRGFPVPDVVVFLACTKDKLAGGESGILDQVGRTDTQGRYVARHLMREGRMHFRKPGYVEAVLDLRDHAGAVIDTSLAQACEFQLEGTFQGTIELRDAKDRRVEIHNDAQCQQRVRDWLELDGDKTKSLFASEEAVTLVHATDAGATERRVIQLVPGMRTVLRL